MRSAKMESTASLSAFSPTAPAFCTAAAFDHIGTGNRHGLHLPLNLRKNALPPHRNYYPGRHCAHSDVLWLKSHLLQDSPASLAYRPFSRKPLHSSSPLPPAPISASYCASWQDRPRDESAFGVPLFLAAVSRTAVCGLASGIAKGVFRTLALLPQLVSEIRIFLPAIAYASFAS